ncbi:hypothetical protein Tco_0897905, partial [Tanacetum coccineum]
MDDFRELRCSVIVVIVTINGMLSAALGFAAEATVPRIYEHLRPKLAEMGLLDFIKSTDSFKVKVEERTLAENEVSLITETEDMVISPSRQIVSLVDHNIQDELNVNADKRKKRVAFVFGLPPMKKARTGGIVISEPRPSTVGKSPTALQRLIRQGEQAAAGSLLLMEQRILLLLLLP